jgi:hypothetical protein
MKPKTLFLILFLPTFCFGQFPFGDPINVNLYYSNKFIVKGKDTTFILLSDIRDLKSGIDKAHDLMPFNSYQFILPKNIKDGRYICFYDSAQKRPAQKFSIKNKRYDGLFEEYYSHGSLFYTTFYMNGLRNGLDIIYYPDGKVDSMAQYKDGKAFGFRISSFYNSTTARISYYENDTTSTIIEDWGITLDEKPSLHKRRKIKIDK